MNSDFESDHVVDAGAPATPEVVAGAVVVLSSVTSWPAAIEFPAGRGAGHVIVGPASALAGVLAVARGSVEREENVLAGCGPVAAGGH